MSLEVGISGFYLQGREMGTEPQGCKLDLRGNGGNGKVKGKKFLICKLCTISMGYRLLWVSAA